MKRLVFCLIGAFVCFLVSGVNIRADVKNTTSGNQIDYAITQDGNSASTIQFKVNNSEGQETTTECLVNPSSGAGGQATMLEQIPVPEEDTDILINSSGFENSTANNGEDPVKPAGPTIPPKQPIYPNTPDTPKPPSSTPEPSTLLILGLGLLGVGSLARRFRQK